MAGRVLYLLVSALLLAVVRTSSIKRVDGKSAEPEDVHQPGTWLPAGAGDVRITDGHPAGVGQFPHQALILADDSTMCGGSLITTTVVLTSGGCTSGHKTWSIRLGGIHRTEDEPTAWIVESAWALVHPEYNASAYLTHNIAVVLLPEAAPLNSFINLVALPSSLDANNSFSGLSAQITGWGRTNNTSGDPETLQWTEVTVIPNSVCSEYYVSGTITDNTICAGNLHTGTCYGDAGGPLVLKTPEGYKLIGVLSFIPAKGCESDLPSGYSRVTAFLDWITTSANIGAE